MILHGATKITIVFQLRTQDVGPSDPNLLNVRVVVRNHTAPEQHAFLVAKHLHRKNSLHTATLPHNSRHYTKLCIVFSILSTCKSSASISSVNCTQLAGMSSTITSARVVSVTLPCLMCSPTFTFSSRAGQGIVGHG